MLGRILPKKYGFDEIGIDDVKSFIYVGVQVVQRMTS